MTIECSNVIMSVGQAIEWGSLLEGTKVEFWHGNYPVADGGYDDCVDLPEHDHTDPEAAGGSGEY